MRCLLWSLIYYLVELVEVVQIGRQLPLSMLLVSVNCSQSVVVTIYSPSVSTVRFTQSTYSVNEDDGKVDITLQHSNPSSIDITLRMNSSSVTANGE